MLHLVVSSALSLPTLEGSLAFLVFHDPRKELSPGTLEKVSRFLVFFSWLNEGHVFLKECYRGVK